ncbi:hypothetical protein [Massilia phyllosphaerae]|uniref:hypothetical protein n=1 Tax=Massilia phyllosphaerae TaxID=3106034 RepID=UPI002B1CD88E|nr:hypothetical protein [Massilia sp. SGZ-792]
MNQTTNTTANIDLAQLDKLEALARASETQGWYGIYQLADGVTDNLDAAFITAANPATVQELVALARRYLTSGAPATDGDLSGASLDDVVDNLREYASNPGYSHNDYADMMRQAANTIESLRAMFWNYSAVVHDAAAPSAEQALAPLPKSGDKWPNFEQFTGNDMRAYGMACIQLAGAAAKTDHAPSYMVYNHSQHPYGGGWRFADKAAYDAAADNDRMMIYQASAAGAGSDHAPVCEHCGRAPGERRDECENCPASVTVQDERALFEAALRAAHGENLTEEDVDACWSELPGYAWRKARAAHPVQDGEKDAERLDWIDAQIAEKGSIWILPCGADMRFVQVRMAGHCTNYPTMEGKAREAIDAAMAAAQQDAKGGAA